jgi:hypothetical protein
MNMCCSPGVRTRSRNPDERAVHAGELKFVLEIRDRAQAAQHHARILRAHELGQQPGEAHHAHVLDVGEHLARHLDALLQREEGALGAAVGDAEHERVEQAARAPHQVFVAARKRVKRSRINRFDHVRPIATIGSSPARPCCVSVQSTARPQAPGILIRHRRARVAPAVHEAFQAMPAATFCLNGGSRKTTSKRSRRHRCEIAERIATDDLHLVGAERGAVALELRSADAVLFDHHHAARAARSRLESRARRCRRKDPGRRALERLSEPVEAGFRARDRASGAARAARARAAGDCDTCRR